MLTLGGIQLRGLFSIQTEAAKIFLNSCYPDDIVSKQNMHQALLMLDAYMTLTGFNPQTMSLYDHAGFRGFLHKVLQRTEDDTKSITRQLFESFVLVGLLKEDQANLVQQMPQTECNEYYQKREPTRCRFLHYQSLFPTSDPNGFVQVDFESIMHLLSKESFNCLGSLLTEYLAPLPKMHAEIDAPLIIAIAQGLLYQHPGVDFCDIQMSAASSTEFIASARDISEWQMHNAGYFRGEAAENWKYLSHVIMKFFVANKIFQINKKSRKLLILGD